MTKKKVLIIISILIFVGSFITFYSGNMITSDISNMFYGINDSYYVSSIPFLMISLYFIIGLLFVIRLYRYNERKKSLFKLYSILFGCVGIIGFIFSIITAITYGSIVSNYPIYCYPLLMMIIHLVMIGISVYTLFFYLPKMEEDTEHKHIKVKYAVNSIVLSILLFLSFYRLGSVIWMPIYVQYRTLYLTFPFYLWVLLPTALVIHIILYFLDFYKNYKQAIIYTGIIFLLNIILGVVVIVLGSKHPIFISAISPALPLERLATKPLDTIIEFTLMFGLGGYYLFYSIRSLLRERKGN